MAKNRQTLEIEKLRHTAPIPLGARVGNVVFSSGIGGKNPDTGELPADATQQALNCFANMKALVELGGATLDDIGRISIYVKSDAIREHVNTAWFKYFPDEKDRPARHIQVYNLTAGMLVQLEVVAVLKS